MPDNDLWDDDDPEVKRLEALMRPLRHDAPLDELRVYRRTRSKLPFIAGGIVAAAAAAAIAVWVTRPAPSPECAPGPWSFTSGGACGVLAVGGTLETGDGSAQLAVADIGRADLGARTVVHLEATGPTKHRLALDRGHMHAVVDAPPRLFEVSTPAVQVVDLGCEYTLDIDPTTNAGEIAVQTGLVELATGGPGVVVVPATTRAAILAGHRPGLPIARTATPEFAARVHAVERGEPGALATMLIAATPSDAITLANAAVVVNSAQRAEVLTRLAELSPPPSPLTVQDVEDPAMYGLWFEDVVTKVLRGK